MTGTATEPELVDRLKLEESTYEGPTGIVGVFQDACVRLDIPAVSYWAAVPHYVAQPPCPKATLALLGRLEDLLEVSIPLGDLPEDARAWERGVDELAEEDEDIAEYVRSLEETRDTTELPEASGEAIAREFERYLKRRDGGERAGPLRAPGHPAYPEPTTVAGSRPRSPGVRGPAASDQSEAEGGVDEGRDRVGGAGARRPGRRRRGWRPPRRRPRRRRAGRRGRRPARRAPRRRPARPGRRRAARSARRHSARVSTASQSSASSHSQSVR